VNVSITIKDTATPLLREIAEAFGPAGVKEANEAGGRGAVGAAGKFHREFDARGGWRGPNSYGSGRSDFGAEIARGWFFREADAGGATISNHAEHYAFKVEGGTIRPKRVNYLTIPLIEEARDRRAKDYEIDFRTKLFTIKGRNALFEKTGEGTESVIGNTLGKRKGGGKKGRVVVEARSTIRPVYALMKSVTQRPWPDAVPPTPILADAFVGGVEEWLDSVTDDD
jgi:hypothetical protein